MSYPKIDQMLLPKGLENYSIAAGELDHPRALAGLSTVNFFVGENNSGKSRLLRSLASDYTPKVRGSGFPKELIAHKKIIFERVNSCNEAVRSVFTNAWENFEFPYRGALPAQIKKEFRETLRVALATKGWQYDELMGDNHCWIEDYVDSEYLKQIVNSVPHRIYVPVLRGLRPIPDLKDLKDEEAGDYYAHRTRKDYFKGVFDGEIYTGLTFYEDLESLLRGDHRQRTVAREFENFLSNELFGGVSVTLIPRKGSDVVWLRLGETEEREIHNMGDGLQQLIILIFPLFKNRAESCHVFIEEPELFLHPGMQRALIKAMRKFDQNQYFLATHSNHFLDLSLEFDNISIYTLHRKREEAEAGDPKKDEFVITLVSSHDFRVLEMLGARTSSVFLSNCTVWVEGITDRRYLAHFLGLYLEHLGKKEDSNHFIPRQDLHYSFVEYSGGNITHWSFLDSEDPILVERLCAKAMLIADKDKGKDERHLQLKEKLGERFRLLPCREIENLLSRDVVKGIMIRYGEPEDSIPDFQRGGYANKPLGRFVDGLLGQQKVRNGKYGSDSGTVTDKLKFCSRAIEIMSTEAFTFEMLSKPAQDLTVAMYEFITTANGG